MKRTGVYVEHTGVFGLGVAISKTEYYRCTGAEESLDQCDKDDDYYCSANRNAAVICLETFGLLNTTKYSYIQYL